MFALCKNAKSICVADCFGFKIISLVCLDWAEIVVAFNLASRYMDDLLHIDNMF